MSVLALKVDIDTYQGMRKDFRGSSRSWRDEAFVRASTSVLARTARALPPSTLKAGLSPEDAQDPRGLDLWDQTALYGTPTQSPPDRVQLSGRSPPARPARA